MANRNEYLLLEQKCLKQYEFAEPYLTIKKPEISFPEGMKARFGFYFLVLKMYTDLSECSDIINSITDTDFNVKFFDQRIQMKGLMQYILMRKIITFAYLTLSTRRNLILIRHRN